MYNKKLSVIFRVFTIINLLLRGMAWGRNVHIFLNERLNIKTAYFTLQDVQDLKDRSFLIPVAVSGTWLTEMLIDRWGKWNSRGHVPTPYAGGRKLMWTRAEQVSTLDRGKANLRYGSHFKPERVTFGHYYPPWKQLLPSYEEPGQALL